MTDQQTLRIKAEVLGALQASGSLKKLREQFDGFGKTDAMRKVSSDMANLNRQFGSVSAVAGTATGSILAAGTGALTAAASMAKFVGSMNDLQSRMTGLKFLSEQTGVAADKIEQLSIAAKKLGVAPEVVSAAYAKMSRESIEIERNTSSVLGEIRSASGGKYAAFADQLRKDGRDVQKLVSDTLKFLAQIPDNEKRAVWAEKLLGSADFAKLFPKGKSSEFDKALADAGKDSKLVTDKLIQQAERYRKAKADLDQDLDDFNMRVAPKYFAAVSGLLKRLGKFLNPDEEAVGKSQAAGGARGELEALIGPARENLRAYEKAHPTDKSSFEYKMIKGEVDALEKRLAKASKEGTKEGVVEGMKATPKGKLDPRGEALGKYAPMSWPGGAAAPGGSLGAAPGTPRIWQANWSGGDVRGGYGYGGVAPQGYGGGGDDGPVIHTPAGPRRAGRTAARGMGRVRRGLGHGGGGGGVTGQGGRQFSGTPRAGSWWTAERRDHAINRLVKEAGLSKAGAEGLVARWAFVEAAAGPSAVNPRSGALGIAQWLGERKRGVRRGDYEGQLTHAIEELNGPEAKAAGVLRRAKNAREGAVGASMFERAEHYNPRTGVDDWTAKSEAGARSWGSKEGTFAVAPPKAADPNISKAPATRPDGHEETPLDRFRRQLRENDQGHFKAKPPGTPEEHRKMFMQSAAQTRHEEAVARLHGRREAFARPLRSQKPLEHRVDTSGRVDMTLNLKGLPQGSKVSSMTNTDGIMGGVRVISNGSHMPVASNR